jgi:hypothetical protein
MRIDASLMSRIVGRELVKTDAFNRQSRETGTSEIAPYRT